MRWLTALLWWRRDGKGSKRRPRRKSVAPRHPALRLGLYGLVAMAVYVAAHAAWQAGWVSRAGTTMASWSETATAALGLRVGEVLLEGRRHTPRAQVLAAIDVRRGDPLLGVDLSEIRARIETIPWVKLASVHRRWPGTVHIIVEEREPIAIWQRNRRLALVDRDGVLIPSKDLEKFSNLLVIVGKDAPAHAEGLLSTLNTRPELRQRVEAAVRVGARRWDIKFKSGIEVLLPEEGMPAAWARLADLEKHHGLLKREIEAIDMRLPDRLIVRTKTAPVSASQSRGQRT